MKRTVLVFGSVSAVLITLWLIIGIGYCHSNNNYEGNMVMGFAAMFLSFSLVFVGVKNYRDKQNGGVISFGKALTLASLTSMVTCITYVVVWIIEYKVFMPDFLDKMIAYLMDSAQKTHDPVKIAETTKQAAEWREWYSTYWGIALMTLMEILPVAAVSSLITALILMRKRPKGVVATTA